MVISAGEVAFDGTLEALRDSTDPRVRDFLAPFRASFNEVTNKSFI